MRVKNPNLSSLTRHDPDARSFPVSDDTYCVPLGPILVVMVSETPIRNVKRERGDHVDDEGDETCDPESYSETQPPLASC